MNKKVLTVAMAYIAIAVGAGFASGQEVLQYFVGFGPWGLVGALAAAIVFSFAGFVIVQLGSYFLASDHKVVFGEVAHPVLAFLFDVTVTVTAFSIGFIMIAGGGTNLNQQFGLPTWVGSAIVIVVVLAMGFLDVSRVTRIIGALTPVLIICVLAVTIYALTHIDATWSDIHASTQLVDTTIAHWSLSSLNYVAMNLCVVASMAIVIGGDISDPKVAGFGGLLGGVFFGVLLLAITVSLYVHVPTVYRDDMPMLTLAASAAPWAGHVMALVVFGMILNSAIGMFYALASRFSTGSTGRFRLVLVALVVAGTVLSAFGFKNLVTWLFPVIGYAGFILMGVLGYSWIRTRRMINEETDRRGRITRLLRRKLRSDRVFSRLDQARLDREVSASFIENAQLVGTIGSETCDDLDARGIAHDDLDGESVLQNQAEPGAPTGEVSAK